MGEESSARGGRTSAMEAAHGRLGNACLLLSRAAGALEAACAEYEAAQQTVKRWCVIARCLFSEPSEDVRARTRLTLPLAVTTPQVPSGD